MLPIYLTWFLLLARYTLNYYQIKKNLFCLYLNLLLRLFLKEPLSERPLTYSPILE